MIESIPPAVTSAQAILTVLPDSDGDHMPDAWELRYGLSQPAGDEDADGVPDALDNAPGTPNPSTWAGTVAMASGEPSLQIVERGHEPKPVKQLSARFDASGRRLPTLAGRLGFELLKKAGLSDQQIKDALTQERETGQTLDQMKDDARRAATCPRPALASGTTAAACP